MPLIIVAITGLMFIAEFPLILRFSRDSAATARGLTKLKK